MGDENKDSIHSSLERDGEAIKRYALSLGFSAVGFAKAGRVSAEMETRMRRWLEDGGNADMAYMANYLDKRLDPRLLMPGLKTIVSVALNYTPAKHLSDGEPQISAYALGKDYHDVVKGKLRQLAAWIDEKKGHEELPHAYRVFVDTGPVLERYWAVQAGLGWIGKNHQLIIPFAGSMFFLGELFLDFELPYDQPMESRCGRCHKCIDACPTGALRFNKSQEGASHTKETASHTKEAASHTKEENRSETAIGEFNASLCLSYQTIENRGQLTDEAKAAMGDMFYGCDRCQKACPWNRFAKPNDTPELQPSDELLHMTREKWKNLTEEDYRRLFKGSAVKRAKYTGIMRNINAMGDKTPDDNHHADKQSLGNEAKTGDLH